MKIVSLALVAALGSAATSAHAATVLDWRVHTDANAYAYNSNGATSSQHDTECNGNCPGYSGTTSEGGVPWTRTSATRRTASSNASAAGYYRFGDPRYDGPTSGTGFASADLSTGELKISHDAVRYGSSSAQADWYDRLHFDLGGATGPVSILIDLRVDGTFEGFTQPRFGFQLSDGSSALATGTVGWSDANPVGPSTTATADFIDFGGGTGRAGAWSIYGPDRFRGTFLLDPRRPDLSVSMYLSAAACRGPTPPSSTPRPSRSRCRRACRSRPRPARS